MFVIVNKYEIFHTQFVGMFTIYYQIKFQIFNFNDSLVIAMLFFDIIQTIALTKIVQFLKTLHKILG